jgi:hypothetical protein
VEFDLILNVVRVKMVIGEIKKIGKTKLRRD